MAQDARGKPIGSGLGHGLRSSFDWLRRLPALGIGRAALKRWPVIQIEVTSRCPLRCVFCPNKAIGAQWQHGDLPWEVYRDNLGPHLARFEVAYLQGWGEPLLHPHLWDMLRLAKASGCKVGFTTCGSLLNEKNGQRVLDEGLDILSVSFAGATAATHEALRVGSNFAALEASVERIVAGRGRAGRGSPSPLLELHFLMMRPNLHELPAFVRLAAELGADEVVATNLSYAPTPDIETLRVFSRQPGAAHQAFVAQAQQEAERLKLRFRVYPLKMDDNMLECDARPTETVFVNHRGEVTPCVYLGLPVQARAPRYFQGEDHPVSPVSFGSVGTGLLDAMESPEREAFAAPFKARKAFARSALALSIAGGAEQDLRLPDPPQVCRHCYKFYGV